MRSSTETIIEAMRILVDVIQSGDGVANAAIFEAAERLEELSSENTKLRAIFPEILKSLGNGSKCSPDSSIEFFQRIPGEIAIMSGRVKAP